MSTYFRKKAGKRNVRATKWKYTEQTHTEILYYDYYLYYDCNS